MRAVEDAQVRRLMEEMTKHGQVGRAAMKSGMDRKTARKYVCLGKLPSEQPTDRTWRTRKDPFEGSWPTIERMLVATPELEVKAMFEWLCEREPATYDRRHLRTLQRRDRQWRAAQGPEQRVMLAQRHRPGEAAQTDFTWATQLGVTIGGKAFDHMLCVFVLPYSNWQWATVCLSESMAALRRGIQAALFQLGRVPIYHQTDHSTAATHRISAAKAAPSSPPRVFNEQYEALMRHLGMTPRTTQVGAKEQNGDVEASNGALKRRLEQALLLRGSRDFEDTSAWQTFIETVVRKANTSRQERVDEELTAMRPLNVDKLPEFIELTVRVSQWSTLRVHHCGYSVPSRLIGHKVTVRLFEERLEVYYGGKQHLKCERLCGRNRHRIDYRHVIWSLVRKPGAFARYVYREEMFPSVVFRRAYDAIQDPHRGIKGDLQYLRILHLAASTQEADIEAALHLLLDEKITPDIDRIRALVKTEDAFESAPPLQAMAVDLSEYDGLLGQVGT